MSSKPDRPYRRETAAIRSQTEASAHREHATAIYMTSSFTFEDAEHARALFAKEVEGAVYTRYSNPSVDEFVAKMCALEGTEDGIAVASGMSAVFTPLAALLSRGDHVVASRSVFGSTHQVITQLLPRWGIEHDYAEITDPASWEAAFRPETRVCYVETPSNPALDLVDLERLAAICRERDTIFIVDNIFATPILQRPVEFGADLVMHSATKYIDGQGRGIGGVILGRKDLIEDIRFFARHSGPALSPFNAWMFSKSLETLDVRMARHCDNAEKLAEFLSDRPEVSEVRYPHLPSHPQYELARRQMSRGGGIVTFTLKGGLDQGRSFLDTLRMCSLTANLGDSRTIATHPASTTHSSLAEEERLAVGITPGLVRISVGLEHIDDIVDDVEQALEASRP
jgi:O-succinylhomoserine sulfhydrylase